MRFFAWYTRAQRGGAVVARKAHNLEVAGASPAPATRRAKILSSERVFAFGPTCCGGGTREGVGKREFPVSESSAKHVENRGFSKERSDVSPPLERSELPPAMIRTLMRRRASSWTSRPRNIFCIFRISWCLTPFSRHGFSGLL